MDLRWIVVSRAQKVRWSLEGCFAGSSWARGLDVADAGRNMGCKEGTEKPVKRRTNACTAERGLELLFSDPLSRHLELNIKKVETVFQLLPNRLKSIVQRFTPKSTSRESIPRQTPSHSIRVFESSQINHIYPRPPPENRGALRLRTPCLRAFHLLAGPASCNCQQPCRRSGILLLDGKYSILSYSGRHVAWIHSSAGRISAEIG